MPTEFIFASGVATVEARKGRFALPKAVVEVWKLSSADKSLIAEIRGEGHLRLHRLIDGRRLLEAQTEAAKEYANDIHAYEWHARTIRDRFREVTFSMADRNRVTLPQELIMVLIGQLSTLRIYVECGPSSIDAMTMEVRLARDKGSIDED